MSEKKNEFTVEITELLKKQIKVYAETEQDAYQIADDLYTNQEVVLTADDFKGMDIEIVDKKLAI